jgi:hypothetical protein
MTVGRWNAAPDKFGGDGVRRCDAARLDVSYHRGKCNGSGIGSLYRYFAASHTSFRGRNYCSPTKRGNLEGAMRATKGRSDQDMA